MRWILFAAGLLGAVPGTAATPSKAPEEDYIFLYDKDARCVPQIGVGIEPKYKTDCERMADPRRYRGTWYVDFETSFFTPVKSPCIEGVTLDYCPDLTLEGMALPWPSRSECGRKFEVEFIGRRNVYRRGFPPYTVVVDKVISARRLPDPPCDRGESNERLVHRALLS